MSSSLLAVLEGSCALDLRRQLRYLQAGIAVPAVAVSQPMQVTPGTHPVRLGRLGAGGPDHWSGPDANRTVRGVFGVVPFCVN